MKLTQKAVVALTLPVGKTDHFEWDDELPGFGYRLRLAAGGKMNRTWTVQYRHGGATRRLLLGSAAVLGAVEARVMAKKALGRVANGEDPQADKLARRDKDAHTFKAAVADYLASKRREVRPRSYTELVRYLGGGYFKPLHSLALDQITRKDVATRLTRITLEHSPIVAARARAKISALFSWALAHGLCEANPVVGTFAPKGGQPRERVLSDAELAAIWKACGDDDHSRCIKLLILTGCRRQEIGGMAWSEFDFERGTWTLPAGRSKNGRAHTLPLLPAVLAVIEAVPHNGEARSALRPARRRLHRMVVRQGGARPACRCAALDRARHSPKRRHQAGRYRGFAARHRANPEPPIRAQARTGGHLQSKLIRARGACRAGDVARPCPQPCRGWRAQAYPSAATCLLMPSAAVCFNDATSWKSDLMSGDAEP